MSVVVPLSARRKQDGLSEVERGRILVCSRGWSSYQGGERVARASAPGPALVSLKSWHLFAGLFHVAGQIFTD